MLVKSTRDQLINLSNESCTTLKKLYEAKPSTICIITCTIISKLDENVCDCLLIIQLYHCLALFSPTMRHCTSASKRAHVSAATTTPTSLMALLPRQQDTSSSRRGMPVSQKIGFSEGKRSRMTVL